MVKHRSKEIKQVVLMVHQFFEKRKQEFQAFLSSQAKDERKGVRAKALELGLSYGKAANMTSEATGVPKRTIRGYKKEFKDFGEVQPPKHSNSGRKKIVIDSFTEGVIRRQILQSYVDKRTLTIKQLHTSLMSDKNFPRMCRATLHRICKKQLKFKWVKFHAKPIPFEREDISAARHFYLRKIRLYRHQGYKVFYQDESWVNENDSPSKGWHIPEHEVLAMGSESEHPDIWLRGVGHRFGDRLLEKPSGAGRRIILIGIGSEDGFLQSCCFKAFIGDKKIKDPDYHSEMNSAHFLTWFKEICEYLPDKSVVVFDMASYHRAQIPNTKNPTTSCRKQEIIDFLVRNHVAVPPDYSSFKDMTVPVLRTLAKQHPVTPVYEVEKIAYDSGKDVKILWLPVAQCELNPIELIWSQIKGAVAKDNTTCKLKDVKVLVESKAANLPEDAWKNCMKHVIKLEDSFVEKEHIIDEFLDSVRTQSPIVIRLGSLEDQEKSESDTADAEDDSETDSEDDESDTSVN